MRSLCQAFGRVILCAMLAVPTVSAAHAVEEEDACSKLPLTIEGQVTLSGICTYRQSVVLSESNTRLNCNGAVFDGEGRRRMGLTITGHGRAIENVTVENCVFKHFSSHGVFITSGIPDYEKKGEIASLYAMSPRHVTLTRVSTEDNGRSGIYVDDYVTNVTIQKSRIHGSGKAGIYLEHSSRENVLRDSDIRGNGISLDGRREGLAIDSSAYNVIERNIFAENGAGAIFLYKNCGEKHSTGKSVVRWQASNHNIISGNTFVSERIGVWIASRQSRDLSKWDCSDASMDATNRYYEDFANHNKVNNNVFCQVEVGVRIEGDFNEVRGNSFSKKTGTDIDLPRTKRETILGRPSIGNRVVHNERANCNLNQ